MRATVEVSLITIINCRSHTRVVMSSDHTILANALGSSFAGIISRVLTHPLDTAKARLQAPTSINPPYRGARDVIFRTFKSEGITSLYRGFGAVLVGGTPGTMAYFCSYEWIKTSISKRKSALPEFAVYFGAGMLAETIACIIYVPVDVIKERLQVQNNVTKNTFQQYQYSGSLDALKQILKVEGMAGLYKGYGATLASFGPFSAFYFLFYENLKAKCNDYLKKQNDMEKSDLSFPYVVLCSATAGAAASWITSPLDMAKLRLQIQRSSKVAISSQSSFQHKDMIDCLSHIYKQGGLQGLFRGAGARVLHFTPATMITMTCFETCRSFFSVYL